MQQYGQLKHTTIDLNIKLIGSKRNVPGKLSNLKTKDQIGEKIQQLIYNKRHTLQNIIEVTQKKQEAREAKAKPGQPATNPNLTPSNRTPPNSNSQPLGTQHQPSEEEKIASEKGSNVFTGSNVVISTGCVDLNSALQPSCEASEKKAEKQGRLHNAPNGSQPSQQYLVNQILKSNICYRTQNSLALKPNMKTKDSIAEVYKLISTRQQPNLDQNETEAGRTEVPRNDQRQVQASNEWPRNQYPLQSMAVNINKNMFNYNINQKSSQDIPLQMDNYNFNIASRYQQSQQQQQQQPDTGPSKHAAQHSKISMKPCYEQFRIENRSFRKT